MYNTAEYTSYAFFGAEVAFSSVVRWTFMKASERVAFFMVVGDVTTITVGGLQAAAKDAAKLMLSKTLIP